MPTVVGVRFHPIGKLYHFDASALTGLRAGDRVIVETARGKQMGEAVMFIPPERQQPGDGGYRPIDRLATPQDLVLQQMWQSREIEAMIECRARAHELGLAVKIVRAEYNYDGSRLTFFYSTEGDDKANTASLRPDMQRRFPKAHVELRQIGPRDVAKLLGGLGACGLETRCCSMFLTDFSPVSIKMAKEQGISLNPQEITGMCGRLRCCLVYEYEQYVTARKTLPKRGKRVGTPRGEGKVIDVNPLKQTVYVELAEARSEFSKDELVPLDELEALQKKSEAPCDRHEGGGCTCGKARRRK
jgi:cell fate regulator YaaT (PSP1 superfamily)